MAFLACTPTIAVFGQVAFPVSFPLSPASGTLTGRQQVNVYVYPVGSAGNPGAAKVVGVDFNWTSDGIITLTAAPGAGMVVDPRRATKINALTKSTVSGGALRAADLAANDAQLLYLEQERLDMDAILQAEIDAKNAILQAEIDLKADKDAIALLAGYAALAIPDSTAGVYPEQFGAVGDGVTNDTTAFQNLANFINAASGGTIILRPGAVYLVGRQALVNDGSFMWRGEKILSLTGLTRPLCIRGNGARFKLAAGLKVGTFNAAGAATAPALPYYGGDRSQPVYDSGVVDIQNCSGALILENFEVDGNEANLNWGGQFGDSGWQVGGDGVYLYNNTGGEHLVRVYSHGCPRDCLDINTGPTPFAKASARVGSSAIGCRFIRGTRQGMSFTGGGGWTFIGCRFLDTGQGSHASAPTAAIDLEAEGGAIIRDVHFINCEFGDTNGGAACLSVGDVEGVSFDHCQFLGATSWSLYGWNKAVFKFCEIVGSFVNISGSQFVRCTISDDPTRSPLGTVYLASGWIPDFGGGTAVPNLFDECVWNMVGAGRAAHASSVDMTCRNCTVGYGPTATGPSFMQPRWEGINVLGPAGFVHVNPDDMGPVALGGDILLNGVSQLKGSKVYDPPNVASGANFSTTVTVPYARMGDYAKASFSLNLAGIVLDAYVSAAHTVTVYGTNKTGGAVDLASGTLEARVHDHTAA